MITKLIEDKDVDEYVREQGIVVLEVLVFEGILKREKVIKYFKKLLIEKMKEKHYKIITGIINGLTDLYPEEAINEIRIAYANNMVDEMMINIDDIENVLKIDKKRAIEEQKSRKHSQLIGNINDEMTWWYCFNKDKNRK